MKESMLNSAVPAAILRKLRLVRQRKMLVQAASALVAATAVLLAAMGVAMLIDWLATLYDSRWRLVLTTTALTFAVCTSIGWLIVAWRRARRLERVAAEVDRQVPRLEERWTTMTRLGDAAKPEVIHPAMLRRVSMEAASSLSASSLKYSRGWRGLRWIWVILRTRCTSGSRRWW